MQAQAPDRSGLVNKNLGPASVNTNWRLGPLNTNWGSGPGASRRTVPRNTKTPFEHLNTRWVYFSLDNRYFMKMFIFS